MSELKLALIQAELHWQEIEANLAMFEEKIWTIKSQPDLILLPETFTTGFPMRSFDMAELHNGKTFRWMQKMAEQTKATIMGSYVITEGGNYYNRLYALLPDGSHCSYEKRHLFGPGGEGDPYIPGKKRLLFEYKGWKIMPQVCYDLRFPVWSRSQVSSDSLYEYDLLIYVANWPAPRIHAWDTLLKARAIENQAFVAGVTRIGKDEKGMTYPGHSAVYDCWGNEMAYSEKEDILEVTIKRAAMDAFREKLPFQADADSFNLQ